MLNRLPDRKITVEMNRVVPGEGGAEESVVYSGDIARFKYTLVNVTDDHEITDCVPQNSNLWFLDNGTELGDHLKLTVVDSLGEFADAATEFTLGERGGKAIFSLIRRGSLRKIRGG